ncbi:MAG: hypothetical protein KKH68_09670, partial [Proteobacteria bacterium]|nr:hypothetical protein [Pseudomonadota bacterium]
MKKFGAIFVVILFLGILIVSCLYLDLMRYADTPASAEVSEKVFMVPSGQGFKDISHGLYNAGIITHPKKF